MDLLADISAYIVKKEMVSKTKILFIFKIYIYLLIQTKRNKTLKNNIEKKLKFRTTFIC